MDKASDGFLTFAEGKAIRCTLPNCNCDCFCPGKVQVRTCDNCKHGWVIHALDKLGYNSMYPLSMQAEVVLPNVVFDIASLMLYGTQATPIRLKILLDRLFSVLQHEEVIQVLHGFGWTYEDYARGYILQDRGGRVLDKWCIATREEEQIVIQQFLRFGETKSIAQEIILHDNRQRQDQRHELLKQKEAEIKRFERNHHHHQFERSSFGGHRLPVTSPRLQSPVRPQPTLTPSTTRSVSPKRSRSPSPRPMAFDYRKDPIGAALADRRMSGRATSPIMPPRPIPLLTMPESRLPIPPFQTQPQDLTMIKKEPKLSDNSPPKPVMLPSPITAEEKVREKTREPPRDQPRDLCRDQPRDLCRDQPRDLCRDLPRDLGRDMPRDLAIDHVRETPRELPMTSTPTPNADLDRKLKHMRKSNAPLKMAWSPTMPIGNPTSMISPSGKKRVICNACNKTFCDKGALKIHYSAVHLKEMHRCTVAGCNMLFSSRRSRNRHSANPNPKLHRPQKQKLPEGASIIDDGKNPGARIQGLLSERLYGPSMVSSEIPPTMVRPDVTGMDLSDDRQEPLYYLDDNNRLSLYPYPKRAKMDDDDNASHDQDFMDDGDSSSDGIMADDYSIDDKASERDETGSEKPDNVSRKGKRKSMVPTRCRQPEEEDYMSDENSVDGDETEPAEGPRVQVEHEPKVDDENDTNKTNNNYDKRYNDETKMATLAQVDLMPSVRSDSGDSGVEPDPSQVQNNDHRDSDVDSNASYDFEDPLGIDLTRGDYPIDHKNPLRCLICGKIFDTQFSVKMHFETSHLKHMRTCYVEGCNASFPGRHCRDRHSANASLHPKQDDDISDEEDCMNVSLIDRSDIPIPDPDGDAQCHVCQERFRDNLILKEHFEKVHPKEMFRCTVPHCDKLFSTRKSRNRHSQNENLHRHIGSDNGDVVNVC